MSNKDAAPHKPPRPASDASASRRPASWIDGAELRRRARRRNAIYWAVAVACVLLFVLLIHLLLERTRWTAGHSASLLAHAQLHARG